MTIQQFNSLPISQQKDELFKCCGCAKWVEKLSQKMPFSSVESIKKQSDNIWFDCNEKDWMEAFSHHPKIGDIGSLKKKFAATASWASGEQSAVNSTSTEVLLELKNLNNEYEQKFGFIFIICATGKTAEEMLTILKLRLLNNPADELLNAMQEQNKITHLRLEKFLV